MKGIYSALLVSFDKEGNINEKGLRQIIRHNIDNCKVDGLYVGGSTGENFMLSTDEKKEIFKIAKDEVKDQVKLILELQRMYICHTYRSFRPVFPEYRILLQLPREYRPGVLPVFYQC